MRRIRNLYGDPHKQLSPPPHHPQPGNLHRRHARDRVAGASPRPRDRPPFNRGPRVLLWLVVPAAVAVLLRTFRRGRLEGCWHHAEPARQRTVVRPRAAGVPGAHGGGRRGWIAPGTHYDRGAVVGCCCSHSADIRPRSRSAKTKLPGRCSRSGCGGGISGRPSSARKTAPEHGA